VSEVIRITVTTEETPVNLTVETPETYSVTMSPIAIPTQETLQAFIDSATADATNAAASASASANAAATSEQSAADSETAAEAAQLAAEAAATYAETAIEQIIWNDITFLTFTDSPVTLDATSNGKLFAVDCTSGAVAITLPLISTLDLDFPFSLGIKKTDASANAITVTRAGTDTVDGGTSKTINDQNSGATFIPEESPTPDAWQTCSFGATPADGSITTAKLLDGGVTLSKLAQEVINFLVPVGTKIESIRTDVPNGFVSGMNKSIGKTSGDYQGSSYFALYGYLWAMSGLSTTAGDPFRISTTKGASALADWDALKTITIDFETNEIFTRAKGSSRNLGSYQADDLKAHTHTVNNNTSSAGSSNNSSGGAAFNTTFNTGSTGGAETRPKNTALNVYFKY
jgi:hypothetical protein